MHYTTKTFIGLVQNDINKIRTIKVKNLKSNVIITTTDKGSRSNYGHCNYFKEANCQLSDQDSYRTLQPDPTLKHSKIMNDILDQFKNENLLS